MEFSGFLKTNEALFIIRKNVEFIINELICCFFKFEINLILKNSLSKYGFARIAFFSDQAIYLSLNYQNKGIWDYYRFYLQSLLIAWASV